MNIEGVVIPGTKGRYGKAKVTIHVFDTGGRLNYGQAYRAIAGSKHGVFIEYGITPVIAIKKAERQAVKYQNYILQQRRNKINGPKC